MKKNILAVGLLAVAAGLFLAACASPQRIERKGKRLAAEALVQMEKMRAAFDLNNPANLEELLGCSYGEDDYCYSKNFKYKMLFDDENCFIMVVHKDEIFFLESVWEYYHRPGFTINYPETNHCLCDASSELGCNVCKSIEW